MILICFISFSKAETVLLVADWNKVLRRTTLTPRRSKRVKSMLQTPTMSDSLARWDFAHFACLLALVQQKHPLLSEGGGINGWQESAEDGNRLWSHAAAPAPLWPAAIVSSRWELGLLERKASKEETGRYQLKLKERKSGNRELFLGCSEGVGWDSMVLITTHCVCLTSLH